MKMQLFRRITIGGTDRAGIARDASPSHAPLLSFHGFQMHPAWCDLKSGWQDSLRRTAGKTGFVRTVVTRVGNALFHRIWQFLRKTERAAISVP